MSDTYLTNMSNYAHSAQLPDLSQTLCMEKMGCFIHLATQTRPDLIFSVIQLSRRNKKATWRDMFAVDRVLRYVAGTVTVCQTYCSYSLPPELYTTVDVSYNCHADSKLHKGVAIHYGRFSLHSYPCLRSSPSLLVLAQQPSSLGHIQVQGLSCGRVIS